MLTSSPIPKQSVGRTFSIAMISLGVIALIQIGIVAWAFIERFHSKPEDTRIAFHTSPNPDSQPQKSPDAAEQNATSNSTVLPSPTPIPHQEAALSPAQARLEEALAQAQALTDRGDLSTALIRLREALALAPDDPRVLSGLALAYEKLGTPEKAVEYWQHIYNLGKAAAGDYYGLSVKKLFPPDTATENAAPKPDSDGFPAGSVLALMDITKYDSPDTPGKKLTLQVPVKARAGTEIEVQDVNVYVLFYEQVDDGSVVLNNADVVSKWITSPIDWSQNNIQILQVGYSAASLNPKAKNPESRNYYGYIVRVYYKGALQDVRAEPVTLLKQFPPPHNLTNGDAQ